MPREFTPEMGEISGFGGEYEAECRRMVLRGCAWFDANPEAKPVYGLCIDDNDDAKALSNAIVDPEQGCSGAMHHAAVQHCLAIRAMGWDAYVAEMSKPEPVQEAS